jgi:hypothetical protein
MQHGGCKGESGSMKNAIVGFIIDTPPGIRGTGLWMTGLPGLTGWFQKVISCRAFPNRTG